MDEQSCPSRTSREQPRSGLRMVGTDFCAEPALYEKLRARGVWTETLAGCCRDLRSEYVLGNLLEQPADAIWNGQGMVELRRALVAKRPEDISICKACDVPWHGSYSGRTPWRRCVTSSSPAPGGGSGNREAAGHGKVLTVPVTVPTLPNGSRALTRTWYSRSGRRSASSYENRRV